MTIDWLTGAQNFHPLSESFNRDPVLMTLAVLFFGAISASCFLSAVALLSRAGAGLVLGNEGRLMYGFCILANGFFFSSLTLALFWPGHRLLVFVAAIYAGVLIPASIMTVRAVYGR